MGLKNHSEIGWVLREFNTLAEDAHKIGIKAPEIYYHDGKLNGKKSKDKGNDIKANEKAASLVKKAAFSETKIESGDMFEEFEYLLSQKEPGFNELPNIVRKAKSLDMPTLLKDFKPLRLSQLKTRK
ncbi:MAG: hypothetical protein C3F06_02890 [Candidatus Methanoperedenaceae archaeon]|nr:MAG: hypothetical protein C3F06_02890 [Candidatus Methanoperedenaceae archaeon]